jgi:hypothetical protein
MGQESFTGYVIVLARDASRFSAAFIEIRAFV